MKRLIVVLAGTWVILLLTINAVGSPPPDRRKRAAPHS